MREIGEAYVLKLVWLEAGNLELGKRHCVDYDRALLRHLTRLVIQDSDLRSELASRLVGIAHRLFRALRIEESVSVEVPLVEHDCAIRVEGFAGIEQHWLSLVWEFRRERQHRDWQLAGDGYGSSLDPNLALRICNLQANDVVTVVRVGMRGVTSGGFVPIAEVPNP